MATQETAGLTARLHAIIQKQMEDVGEDTLDGLSPSELAEFLAECHKLSKNKTLAILFNRIREPAVKYLVESAVSMDEVWPQRSILLVINDMEKLIDSLARQYDEMNEQTKGNSEIIPNP